ncbi:hypothetical protein NKI50_03615 [Mesorhizobium sp. M0563]|uniref:hypothetical protein n=1 Tax=Mesorhizobium sp. M0563 TaxID=2956959 RepID=UPI00333697ED
MGRLRNPLLFSSHFGIEAAKLAEFGAFDPVLNADTKLFIDPMLLKDAADQTFAHDARIAFTSYFETVIKLIGGSNRQGDAPWKAAERMLQFPEVRFTCLGYGGSTIRGSGGGRMQTDNLVRTAREIIELGVTDPDLFVAMALIEEGIGPDRISDMTSKIIMAQLIEYTNRACDRFLVPTAKLTFRLGNGEQFSGDLPANPSERDSSPILLVPQTVLRDLPVASDWDSVSDAASKNSALRADVNREIAGVWAARSKKDKEAIRNWALSDKSAFDNLLELLREVPLKGYDFGGDPAGEVFWKKLIDNLNAADIAKVAAPETWTAKTVSSVVEQIIENFRHLIEDRRLSEELYHTGKPRPEKAAQRLFFVVAHAFCKANNLDLTPEADTGNGPVDFKVSSGFNTRVLVEIKLSTNGKLVVGYTRQLHTYATAEEAAAAYYLVVDVGHMGEKLDNLFAERNILAMQGKPIRPIKLVDGTRKPSASKL